LGVGDCGLEQEEECDPKKQGFYADKDVFIHLSLDTGYTCGRFGVSWWGMERDPDGALTACRARAPSARFEERSSR
jgi:hypothetical protein